MQFNLSRQYPSDKVKIVVDQLMQELKLRFTDSEIKGAFSQAGLPVPDAETLDGMRKILIAERDKVMEALCVRIERKFDQSPKPRDIIVAIEAAGYKYSRHFREELQKRVQERNAERWAEAEANKKTIRPSLIDGEKAMWDALARIYNLESGAVASMLLRIFTIAAQTGKIDYLQVPFLAASLTDKELKKYAESLNFTVTKTRRTRVR